MRRADPNGALALGVALLSAFAAATCSRESHLEPRAPHAARETQLGVGASASARPPAAPLASASARAVTPPAKASNPEVLSFAHLYAALFGLEDGTRKDHVRVLWLGDSHTAADFMTGETRKRLQARFGNGGPGLVRLGASPYRHDGVHIVRDGRFNVEPDPPSRRSDPDDAAFGYAGMRTLPRDQRARAELRVDEHAVVGQVRYELFFDLPDDASFRVSLGSEHDDVKAGSPLLHVPGSPIARLRFSAPAHEPFAVERMHGRPRFYGVIAEAEKPGLVLDTSGIDGARVGTALSWDAGVLAAEVAARSPDLFVLAYGTNEAFDNRRAEPIGGEAEELVARLRRGAPQADCLVLGPPDAASPDLTSLPRVAEIDAVLYSAAQRSGCGFLSLRAAMGGDGGFARFLHDTPQLARPDRIHFTVAGYEKLGGAVADALLAAYDAYPRK